MIRIVIASRNQAKIREIREICHGLSVEWSSILDYPGAPGVVEDGVSYRENAEKKALETALFTGCWGLADDSGIEVDALGGRPGLFSARYARGGATDGENNRKLLSELSDVPDPQRTARYRAVVVLADPQTVLCVGEGTCEGRIGQVPKGSGGFGYDPLFFVPDYGRMMAELGSEIKNQISHRAAALRAIRDYVQKLAFS